MFGLNFYELINKVIYEDSTNFPNYGIVICKLCGFNIIGKSYDGNIWPNLLDPHP